MQISKIRISNFANFGDFEVATGQNLVVVGENKVGKSNLLFALQLVLDPGLSERDRQLDLEQFWDGLGEGKLGATVEVSVELKGFDASARLLAHLADCIVDAGPPLVARLTYRFQPRPGLGREPAGVADYEHTVFGGVDPENAIRPGLRRMLPLDVLHALRDAEKDLVSWRRSPLRPLIERMSATIDEDGREAFEASANSVQESLQGLEAIGTLGGTISDRLVAMVGSAHATPVTVGLSPTRMDVLLRALRLLIDNGSRGIGDASLGTANLIFLVLKSLELDELVRDGERDHTFLAVEEPEAHLHPQVQRLVFRHFLAEPPPRGGGGGEEEIAVAGDGAGGDGADEGDADEDAAAPSQLTTILTTHSPHIASVAPLRSIVLLRRDFASNQTVGVSTVNATLTKGDEDDLQRYIDVNRGELFFTRGVILVEGDAERFLVPAFANALGIHLDQLGISVCSVAGTNFRPYVKLLGRSGLAIPYVILTDLDPNGDNPPFARRRVIDILELVEPGPAYEGLADNAIFMRGEDHGVFVNRGTLETGLFRSGLGAAMGRILTDELSMRQASRERLAGWVANPETLNGERFIDAIERIGKGRFAQRLAPGVTAASCPEYIRDALERIRDAVP